MSSPTETSSTETDARVRMIQVAERLFAKHGIEGVSLRRIGIEAGQRFKSAPQYYFGDRDSLVSSVLAYRQKGVNLRRESMLSQLEQDGRLHDLRGLMEALVCPLAELVGTDAASYLGFLASLSRYRESEGLLAAIERYRENERDIVLAPGRPHTLGAVRVMDLVIESLDRLDPTDRHNRIALLEVMVIHGLSQIPRLVSDSPLPPEPAVISFVDSLIDALIRVLTGGLGEEPRPGDGARHGTPLPTGSTAAADPSTPMRPPDPTPSPRTIDIGRSAAMTIDLRVEPLSAALGAIVHGIDLAHIDDELSGAIRAAWLEHKVLIFRDQDITPEDHLRFAQSMGTVEIHPYASVGNLEGHPGIQVLHSEKGGRADVWHSDATFEVRPPMATILRYVSGPSRGGDTMWSDQSIAYERMSAAVRATLEGLSAVHTAATFGKPNDGAEHPVVRIHPETGQPALYVNRLFTSHIPQLHDRESAALLEHLYQWSVQPELTCRWSWRKGDVVMWDNRCTQHYAVNDYDEPRIMQRVIVEGDRPSGAPVAWPDHEVGRLSARTGVLQRVGAASVERIPR